MKRLLTKQEFYRFYSRIETRCQGRRDVAARKYDQYRKTRDTRQKRRMERAGSEYPIWPLSEAFALAVLEMYRDHGSGDYSRVWPHYNAKQIRMAEAYQVQRGVRVQIQVQKGVKGMAHLKYGCLDKERKLRYYQMIERICAGNQDTAHKLWYVQQDKIAERSKKRGHWTIAEKFTRDLLVCYENCGNDYERALRVWIGRKFCKIARAYDWYEAPRFQAQSKPATAPNKPSPEELMKVAEQRMSELLAAYHASEPEVQKEMEPVIANIQARLAAQRDKLPTPAKTPIEVKFKHPLDKGANSNTALVRDGQPIAQIKAGGGAEDFWRGVLYTMDFAKDELN